MFRVVYLPTNAAYAVKFGDSLLSLDAYEYGRRLFSTRRDLMHALRSIGLDVDSRGNVYSTRQA